MPERPEYRVVKEGRILRIVVEGAFDGAAAIAAARRALELAVVHWIGRFLFDARKAPNKTSIIAKYDFAYRRLAVLGAPKALRVALLVAPEDHSYDTVENLCLNAGYTAKLFREEDEALVWLEP